MRSVWHLLFLLAVRTVEVRCRMQGLVNSANVMAEALGRIIGVGVEQVAIDVAHWLPNMPRGHEAL
jgi:hypothetical protein